MPSFRFRLVPFIATVILVALGCSLSWWQTQRALQKEVIEAKLTERENRPAIDLPLSADLNQLEYARVILKGEFVKDWPVYLDNRPMNGATGIVVMMPFKLQDRQTVVLVARGWIPRNPQNRTTIKGYDTPSGTVTIQGIVKPHSGHVLQLGQRLPLQAAALVQNLDVGEYAQVSNLPVYPFIVEQTGDIQDGLLRAWPRASLGSERHRGYAFQWLALAGMALLFFLATGFKYGRKRYERESRGDISDISDTR